MLGQRFLDISQALTNTLYGTTTSTARWKRCIGNVQAGTFVYATGRLYVAENFPATAKAKVQTFKYWYLKGKVHVGDYSQKNINLKTDLVTSIGELLIV